MVHKLSNEERIQATECLTRSRKTGGVGEGKKERNLHQFKFVILPYICIAV